MTSNGRVARLTALALATGTLVAAGAGSAAAASTTKTTDKIQALGNGSVVHVRIALPAALSALPTGNIIDQYISLTDGTVTTVNSLGAKSVGTIGKGSVPVLSSVLDKVATSDLNGKQSDSVSLVDQDKLAGIATLKALVAKSKVANPTVDGVLAHSESTVAAAKIDALDLKALLPDLPVSADVLPAVLGALDTVVDTAQETTNAATSTVTGVLTTAIETLNDATGGATTGTTDTVSAPVEAAIDEVAGALETLLDSIQQTVSGLTADATLLDLGVMTSDQTISRSGSQVTSSVVNKLAGLSILGDLITVDALQSKASATAGGKAGTASVIHEPGVLTVKVADALTLKIGKTIELGGTLGDTVNSLPGNLPGTVNDALAQVLGALRDTLGLDFQPGSFVESVAKDGSSAATTVNAAKLVVSPPAIQSLLPAGEKLLTVEMVGAQAAVGAQVVNITSNPPVNTPPATVTSLPRTGMSPLVGFAAVGLMGLAVVARRRKLAHEA